MSSSPVVRAGNGISGVRTGGFQVGETVGSFAAGERRGGEVGAALGTHAAESGPPSAAYLEDETAVIPWSKLLRKAELRAGRYVQIPGAPVEETARCSNVAGDRSESAHLRNSPQNPPAYYYLNITLGA